ncbi:hypothetical protein [Conexibacter sp. SYSU D00693]|uniref:hypothetical protein n=1 Tax=Conexibacter sp. SYSU D00693 TaxID=2812560 RepID=UPI00196B41B2|nr:hypothetical protein [Conexibacter sp. SYSU D00693]
MSSPVDRGATVALSGALGGWLLATAASQHPHRLFDGLRRFDRLGLVLPNWRFFAPEPAQHDFHLLHRVVTADGATTPWEETAPIASRRWAHVVFFADRRREKGMFDVANEVITVLGQPSSDVTKTVAFELLRNRVEVEVLRRHGDGPRPKGFQFLVARHTGYDESGDPDYVLSSPFFALDEAPA